eukprot:Rmarinus@m.28801
MFTCNLQGCSSLYDSIRLFVVHFIQRHDHSPEDIEIECRLCSIGMSKNIVWNATKSGRKLAYNHYNRYHTDKPESETFNVKVLPTGCCPVKAKPLSIRQRLVDNEDVQSAAMSPPQLPVGDDTIMSSPSPFQLPEGDYLPSSIQHPTVEAAGLNNLADDCDVQEENLSQLDEGIDEEIEDNDPDCLAAEHIIGKDGFQDILSLAFEEDDEQSTKRCATDMTLFMLQMRYFLTVSQSIVKEMMNGLMYSIFPRFETIVAVRLLRSLRMYGFNISDDTYKKVMKNISVGEIARSLYKKSSTIYHQDKFFDTISKRRKPVEVVLGTKNVPTGVREETSEEESDSEIRKRSRREKLRMESRGYTVSFIEMLQDTCKDRRFAAAFVSGLRKLHKVAKTTDPPPFIMKSLMDTKAMQEFVWKHRYNANEDQFDQREYLDGTCYTLPLLFYHDGVNLGSPTRTASDKKNVTGFYVHVGCLPPEASARLDCIFAIAFATSSDLKNVSNARQNLLKSFWDEMRSLNRGIILDCEGYGKVLVKGGIFFSKGDQPAQAVTTGTNETTGISLRQCRHCFWGEADKKKDIERRLRNLTDQAYILETPARTSEGIYRTWQSQMESPSTLNKEKKQSGVTAAPLFPEDLGFDLVTGTPQDVMHNLFEGPLVWTIRHMMRKIAQKNYNLALTVVEYINIFSQTRMQRYSKDRPIIPKSFLNFSVPYGSGMSGMKAVQVWNTAVAIPWAFKAAGVTYATTPWVRVFTCLLRSMHFMMLRYMYCIYN